MLDGGRNVRLRTERLTEDKTFVALICPTLVLLFLLSLGRNAHLRIIDAL